MADYRRVRIAGGCYFFTVALLNRRSTALVQHIDLLRRSVALARQRRPFHIDAWVVLPDHMHCMWTLPDGDADYSSRWRHLKNTFSRGVPKTENVPVSWQHRGERGIWQRRYWEHTVRDDEDYERHFDYIHLNPYKHGLVRHVKDWPYSSFHRHALNGIYDINWLTDGVAMDCGERSK